MKKRATGDGGRIIPTPVVETAANFPASFTSVVFDATGSSMLLPERLTLYTLIVSLQPFHVLEVGVSEGESSRILVRAMDDINRGHLYSVDPAPRIAPELLHSLEHRMSIVTGHCPEVVADLRAEAEAGFDLALIDGDRTYEGITRDIRGILPYLADMAYMLFHDAYHHEVRLAIDDCIGENTEQLQDCGIICRASVQDDGNFGQEKAVYWGGIRLVAFSRNGLCRRDAGLVERSRKEVRGTERTQADVSAPITVDAREAHRGSMSAEPESVQTLSDQFAALQASGAWFRALPRPLGGAMRTLMRIRNLGKAWNIQSRIHEILITRQDGIDAYLTSRMSASTDRQNGLEALFGAMTERYDELQAYIVNNGSRTFQSEDAEQLVATVARNVPVLADASPVRLTVREASGEFALADAPRRNLAMAESAKTEATRTKVWYHFDFSARWNDIALFEQAQRELDPDEYFVLVTHKDHMDPIDARGLVVINDGRWVARLGIGIRVVVFRLPRLETYRMQSGYWMYMTQDDPGPVAKSIRTHGIWKPGETRFVSQCLRPGAVFVHVGAHMGYFSMLAAHIVGPTGRVFAVESDPVNVGILRRNRAILPEPTMLRVLEGAAGDIPGQAYLCQPSMNHGDHRLYGISEGDSLFDRDVQRIARLPIQVQHMDDVLKNVAHVDLIKCETQGYDLWALRGMRHLLQRDHPTVMVHCWPYGMTQAGYAPRELVDFLIQLGYNLFVFDEDTQETEPLNGVLLDSLAEGHFVNLVARLDSLGEQR